MQFASLYRSRYPAVQKLTVLPERRTHLLYVEYPMTGLIAILCSHQVFIKSAFFIGLPFDLVKICLVSSRLLMSLVASLISKKISVERSINSTIV